MLRLERATRRFGGVLAVDGLDLVVERNSIHALIGPNGAGKTTVFNIVTGAVAPDQGRVWIDKTELTGRPPHAIAAQGVARTFQNIRLYSSGSAIENVMLGAAARWDVKLRDVYLKPRSLARRRRAFRQRAEAVLAMVGLHDKRDAVATELPYGDRRRLEIARALISDPRLVLLDEPTAGMNRAEVDGLAAIISNLRADGLTILLIEHNVRFVWSLADAVTVLDYGRKIAEGDPSAIQSDPRVIEAYLGT